MLPIDSSPTLRSLTVELRAPGVSDPIQFRPSFSSLCVTLCVHGTTLSIRTVPTSSSLQVSSLLWSQVSHEPYMTETIEVKKLEINQVKKLVGTVIGYPCVMVNGHLPIAGPSAWN